MQTKGKATLPIAIGLLVVAVGIGFAAKAMMPHTEEVKPVDNSKQTSWISQKAQETQGDITKLSAEDQQKVRQMLGGMADNGFKMMFEHPPK